MKYPIQKWLLLAPIALSLTLAGCGSTGTDGTRAKMSLSFSTNGLQASAKQSSTIQSSHVTITEAKMLLREIEFENDIEDDGVAEDSLEFETGPLVVALNLDGSLNEVAVQEVAVGRYNEIEFDVHKPEGNETPPDPDFKIGDSGDERFSVIIRGTFNGADFLYRSKENMEQEIELASPLTINEDTQNINVTLTVDVSTWFIDENGNDLNPTNPDNANAIDESIKRSFDKAFEDNDQDGESD